MLITYVKGDATYLPIAEKPQLLVHIVNDIGAWGKGFVLAVSKKWPSAKTKYKRWISDNVEAGVGVLGGVFIHKLDEHVEIAHMCAQHGIRKNMHGPAPIRYDALERALTTVAVQFTATKKWAGVHMPYIGCGLAGGTWPEVELIVRRTLCARRVPTTVYEF